MLNNFVPYPRYERAVFIGDTATEYLAALKIYAYALVGGEVPSMELLHPQEKPLECVACAMHNKPQVLKSALTKIPADYVLLEDNHRAELNPASMKEGLEAAGVPVKVLDVTGTVPEVLRRAGAMFDADKQAERVIRDYEERFRLLREAPQATKPQKLLILLSIRQPVTLETFLFAVTDSHELSQAVAREFGYANVTVSDPEKEQIPGLTELNAESLSELLVKQPAAVALTGDGTAGAVAIEKAVKKQPALKTIPALVNHRVWPLPFYCGALAWREPLILQVWKEAVMEREELTLLVR